MNNRCLELDHSIQHYFVFTEKTREYFVLWHMNELFLIEKCFQIFYFAANEWIVLNWIG